MGQPRKSLVELSFSTLNAFLKGKLSKASSQQASPKETGKKRVYDNSKRAAAAEANKRLKPKKVGNTRLARNSEETWWMQSTCRFVCFHFGST